MRQFVLSGGWEGAMSVCLECIVYVVWVNSLSVCLSALLSVCLSVCLLCRADCVAVSSDTPSRTEFKLEFGHFFHN